MNNEQDIMKRLKALELWKDQRERQQITFPLDKQSIDVLNRFFMRIVDDYTYFGGVGDNSFRIFVGKQGTRLFDVSPGLVQYTADPSTNVLTIVDKQAYPEGLPPNKFGNDETLVLYTTDTMPGGLSGQGLTTYYVVQAASDGYSFKLSATLGGAAIDITSTGAGKQLLQRI